MRPHSTLDDVYLRDSLDLAPAIQMIGSKNRSGSFRPPGLVRLDRCPLGLQDRSAQESGEWCTVSTN